jgi:hypothetical protein
MQISVRTRAARKMMRKIVENEEEIDAPGRMACLFS